MHTKVTKLRAVLLLLVVALLASGLAHSKAYAIAQTFDLYASVGSTTLPDGVTVPVWGYTLTGDPVTAPGGPTLVVNAGDSVTVTLHNNLPEGTSLLFQGQAMTPDTSGVAAGGTKSYTFDAPNPGTYLYEAGLVDNAAHQVALGLYGALIVRPATLNQAYDSAATAYDEEAVLVLSEIDPSLNNSATPQTFDMRNYHPTYWLINGKAFPATDGIPTQMNHKVLLRYVNAGLQLHSMGLLGARQEVIATDGSLSTYSHQFVSETLSTGQTQDVIVTIPASATDGTRFALYDASMLLHNSGAAGTGGMLTFISVGTAGTGSGDTVGPVANALALSSTRVAGSSPVTLGATLDDTAKGGSNITAAEYFFDAPGASTFGAAMTGSFGSPTAAVQATLSVVDLAALPSGSHKIYIHGQDSAGNWGAFNFITLNLDKTGPTATGLTVSPSPTNGSANVALSASANDTASGNGNIQAGEYFIDISGANGAGAAMTVNTAAPIASLTAAIPAASIAALSEGSHTLYVHAQDDLGNWGAFGTVALTVDKTGPTNSLSSTIAKSPNNGKLNYDTNTAVVRVTTTFTDVAAKISTGEAFIDTLGANGAGIPFVPVDGLFNSASEAARVDIPLSTVLLMTNGSHTIYFHGKDTAGNWGAVNTVTLVVDKALPTVSGLTLTPTAANNTAVAISASASDVATGNSNIGKGEYFFDTLGTAGTGVAMTAAAALPSTTISATIPAATVAALTAGNHTIYVRSMDVAGNWSNALSATLLIDRTAPTFTGITLSPTSIPVGTATVNLTVSGATDPLVSSLASGVTGGEYWFGATDITAGTGTAFPGLSASINTAALTAGTYTVRVRIRDAAGNWSTGTGGVRTATLTVTAPVIPQPSLYFSISGNTNPAGVGGTADDADIYFYNSPTFTRSIDVTTITNPLPTGANVDGFDRISATQFYMSFDGTVTISLPGPDLTVQDEDVVFYNAGAWTLYYDGSVNGVTSNLDAISIVGGNLYFSLSTTTVSPGAGGSGDDADIYRWNGGSSYTRVVDASAITNPLPGSANVDGFVWVDATHFYMSFSSSTTIVLPGPDLTVEDEDVVYYNAGVWTIYFDGSAVGLDVSGNLDIDAFDLP